MSKKKYDIDSDEEEQNIVFSIADDDSEDEIVEKKISGTGQKLSWKQYMAKHFSGKKFNNKQEANAFMKELGRKYKEQK